MGLDKLSNIYNLKSFYCFDILKRMQQGVEFYLFGIGGVIGTIISVLGGYIIRGIYKDLEIERSRITRLEDSQNKILQMISVNNSDLMKVIHDMELKFINTIHQEVSSINQEIALSVKTMHDMQDKARETLHDTQERARETFITKEDHEKMIKNIENNISSGFKRIYDQFNVVHTQLALRLDDQATISKVTPVKA